MSPERSIETIGEKSRVTNPPANFENYRARQQLIAKRNATDDPVKRESINILIEQMNEHDKCAPEDHERRTLLRRQIMRQMAIVAF